MKYLDGSWTHAVGGSPNHDATFGPRKAEEFCPTCDLRLSWCECPTVCPGLHYCSPDPGEGCEVHGCLPQVCRCPGPDAHEVLRKPWGPYTFTVLKCPRVPPGKLSISATAYAGPDRCPYCGDKVQP